MTLGHQIGPHRHIARQCVDVQLAKGTKTGLQFVSFVLLFVCLLFLCFCFVYSFGVFHVVLFCVLLFF